MQDEFKRRTLIVYPLCDKNQSPEFVKNLLIGWTENIVAPLNNSLKFLYEINKENGLDEFAKIDFSILSALCRAEHYAGPLDTILNFDKPEEAEFHEYRFLAGINLVFAPASTISQKSRSIDIPAPLILLDVSTKHSGNHILSREISTEAALKLHLPQDVKAVSILLHDLALDSFCCIQLLNSFLDISPKKRRSVMKRVGALKVKYFLENKLSFYGEPVQPNDIPWYIPFTAACRKSIRSKLDASDYTNLLHHWRQFQALLLRQDIPEANIIVGSGSDVIKAIENSSQKDIKKCFGQLSQKKIKTAIEKVVTQFGPGDYMFVLLDKCPKDNSRAESIVKRMTQSMGSNGKWRGRRWCFERYNCDQGYQVFGRNAHIMRFRFLPKTFNHK